MHGDFKVGISGPRNLYWRSAEVSFFGNWSMEASSWSVVGGRDRTENKECVGEDGASWRTGQDDESALV